MSVFTLKLPSFYNFASEASNLIFLCFAPKSMKKFRGKNLIFIFLALENPNFLFRRHLAYKWNPGIILDYPRPWSSSWSIHQPEAEKQENFLCFNHFSAKCKSFNAKVTIHHSWNSYVQISFATAHFVFKLYSQKQARKSP